MKYIFIVNRTLGKMNYDLIEEKIKSNLKNEDFKIIETKKVLDATEIAKKYKNDENTIVYSVGGDGTLNEVVNGLAGGKAFLGIIPTGSGNDFYKTLKTYKKKEGKIDLGLINGRYFINIASVGFDAEICHKANELKLKGKKNAYVKGIIKTFFKYKNKDLEIEVNNKKIRGKYTLCAICNGKYYGGGFKISPLSSFDDDHLDFIYADSMNKIRLIFMFLKLFKGTHEKDKKVHKVLTEKLKISSKEELILNIDGEIVKTKNIDVRIVKDVLKIYNDTSLVESIIK